ncbi:twin-arginine translocase subunit TatC [Lapillicoccus sp.]|uniref:twin-arginine translocase subunit TatC n=1 Tax=Lapillicoccus sp. TaxID=1909287 RepID=UPI0025EEB77C|nr:twin-arginine translocase subunit TatC [Lapillicoccus sp.]
MARTEKVDTGEKRGMRRRLRKQRDPEGRMSLGDHLRELRRRVIISGVAILVGAGIGWWQYDNLFNRLIAPIKDLARERKQEIATLNFPDLTGSFTLLITVGLFTGLILASPVWLYQIWGFIVPGLSRREKRTSLLFIGSAVPLFIGGCTLGFIVLPRAAAALLSFTPAGASNILPAPDYLNFVLRFILAFGLAFLLPVFLVGLNAAGILPARILVKAWRPAVFLIFLFAAVMTPTPDAWTMLFLAVPMIILFYLAVGISFLLDRRKAKRDVTAEWRDLADDEASPL